MTKTAAAETVALQVRVFCRKNGEQPTKLLAAEIVSELRGGARGTFLQTAALEANVTTVLRLAKAGL